MIHLLESVRKLCGSWNSFLARVLVELKLARSWQLCLIRFAIPFAEWMFHNHFETAFFRIREAKKRAAEAATPNVKPTSPSGLFSSFQK